MAASSTIPRFLLPQLTWQAAALSSRAPPSGALASSITAWAATPRRQLSYYQSRTQQRQHPRHASPPSRSLQQARLTDSLFSALSYSHQAPPVWDNNSSSGGGGASGLARGRGFSTSARRGRDHHFDTLKFVQRLRDEGFSDEQATAMMRVLADVIEESIQNLTRTLVPREDAERATYTQKVDFTKLRSELLAADGTEAQVARQAHERLANDIAKLSGRLRDEIGRTQASVRLDLNLEKGRIKEEANNQETKIKETESRIEQEVAALRERIEGVKFNTLQWLVGFFTGISALMLGAWRLLM